MSIFSFVSWSFPTFTTLVRVHFVFVLCHEVTHVIFAGNHSSSLLLYAHKHNTPHPVSQIVLFSECQSNSWQFLNITQVLTACRPALPVLLPATSGQGLQISGQLIRRDGKVYYSLKFENLSQVPLDGFMIQFNKNTFGLAAGGALQVTTLYFCIV